jgi:chromosome segregation ATPase
MPSDKPMTDDEVRAALRAAARTRSEYPKGVERLSWSDGYYLCRALAEALAEVERLKHVLANEQTSNGQVYAELRENYEQVRQAYARLEAELAAAVTDGQSWRMQAGDAEKRIDREVARVIQLTDQNAELCKEVERLKAERDDAVAALDHIGAKVTDVGTRPGVGPEQRSEP